jgi:hypothetical protein
VVNEIPEKRTCALGDGSALSPFPSWFLESPVVPTGSVVLGSFH